MTLFRNNTHKEVWQQRWCRTCFQPDEAARRIQGKETQCPIWEKAMSTDRKPVQWDRNTRTDEMEKSIKCNSYAPKPPITSRDKAIAEDVAMFDVEPHEVHMVPVEGWPERPTKDGVDHA